MKSNIRKIRAWQDVPATAEYSLDELVEVANALLPRHLPASGDCSDARFRDEVNARLVRHLASLGLMDEAGREGREARYGARHLLQLLTTRRLMAEGYTTGAIKKLLSGTDDARLQSLLLGEESASVSTREAAPRGVTERAFRLPSPAASTPAPQSAKQENAALDFLKNVRARTGGSTHATNTQQSTQASQWRRVEIAANLEVHVRDDFQFPPTLHEREILLNRIEDALKNLVRYSQSQRRKK